MKLIKNHLRRLSLFARIVWRVWEKDDGPGSSPYRISMRVAWSVSRTVCLDD